MDSLDVGLKLKFVREKLGLSQRELAKRAGVTNGTISLIEQNRVSPSVSSLKKVLAGLPMTLAEFFTYEEEPSKPRFFYAADELPNLGNEDIQLLLVGKASDRLDMALLREVYAPYSDTGPDMLTHEGQEGGFVIKGEIEVSVDQDTRTLKAGDAYYFESRLPHRFKNNTAEVCEIISASSPPTF